MGFHEKSAAVTLGGLILWYGIYFAMQSEMILSGTGSLAASTAILFVTLVGFVVIVAAGHIVIAMFMQKGDDATDEREHLLSLRAERIGGIVLGVSVLGVLALMLKGVTPYLAANALLAAMFLSEIVTQAAKLVYYRLAG